MLFYTIKIVKKKDLDQKLAMMIARDFQPLSLVEDEGFRKFINALRGSRSDRRTPTDLRPLLSGTKIVDNTDRLFYRSVSLSCLDLTHT